MRQCANFINARYGEGTATLTIKDQYRNMREQVERTDARILDILRQLQSVREDMRRAKG